MHFNDINKDSFEKLLVKVRFNVGQSVILEVIPDNWTQKFEPHGGQISKP